LEMITTDLDDDGDSRECRLCLLGEPQNDFIRPCNCSGSLRYTHRKCLDRWRTVSPHPDSLTTCEICRSKFQIVYKTRDDKWKSRIQYCLVVTLDISFFVAIFVGLWLGFGFLGDFSFNNLLISEISCNNGSTTVISTPSSVTTPTSYPSPQPDSLCQFFEFTKLSIWQGRVWWWGFICLFFVLGIFGCICFCYYREKGSEHSGASANSHYQHNSCYYVCCGPTYYSGYYYSTPYGFWDSNDILCCYLCLNRNASPHHHHYNTGSGCNCNGGGDCGNCSGGDCGCKGGDKDVSVFFGDNSCGGVVGGSVWGDICNVCGIYDSK